ncbi:MAG: S-methyl-5'-thioadenosine phosphorylase [Chloroflexota bacterium]|nr:S-methyl-5'-thioadenosine phosphorylase [Chloroflexota bacterium]
MTSTPPDASTPAASLAVIGGSGFARMEALREPLVWEPATPFGAPSGPITIGTLHGRRVAFLPRHGAGHSLLPQEVPYRANVWALKALGVQGIIAVSAVGSLQESIAPGEMVAPDQIIDRTRHTRPTTFFGDGIVAHVGFADPFCADLSARLVAAGASLGVLVHAGGTYIAIEGPLFSTRAESRLYRAWGGSIIGMTALPEAKLAREAEIAYGMLATATDYDVWHESEADVSVEVVLARLRENVAAAQRIVAETIRALPADWTSTARGALRHAIVTDPARIPARARADLAPIIGEYLP